MAGRLTASTSFTARWCWPQPSSKRAPSRGMSQARPGATDPPGVLGMVSLHGGQAKVAGEPPSSPTPTQDQIKQQADDEPGAYLKSKYVHEMRVWCRDETVFNQPLDDPVAAPQNPPRQ